VKREYRPAHYKWAEGSNPVFMFSPKEEGLSSQQDSLSFLREKGHLSAHKPLGYPKVGMVHPVVYLR